MKQFKSRSRKGQQGFTLIELIIVIAILAIAVFFIYQGVSRANNASIANNEAQSFNMMISDVRTKFGVQGSFTGITDKVIIDLGLVPGTMVQAGKIKTRWGTEVAVTAIALNGSAGDGVQFSYPLPRVNCGDFVTAASGATAKVSVGGAVVKDATTGVNNLNVATLGTACDATAGGNVTVLLAQGR